MEQVINVQPRATSGKGAAHKIRKTGLVPGVLYGHNEKPRSFSVDPNVLRKSLRTSGFGRNTVLKITGLDREVLALLKDSQVDPVKHSVMHVDLLEIREDEDVVVEVPVELVGKPAGVVAGGVLQAVIRTLKLAAKPRSIPKLVQVDVTHLEIGGTLHVGDAKAPEGTKIMSPGKLTLATVFAPKEEEAAKPAAVEGAPAAAEGAAAEGAAAAAAPAAGKAAPAAAGKEAGAAKKK